jgi:hypothetical protein
MRAPRGRLTRRDGDLHVLGLERVLWSELQVLRNTLDPWAEIRVLRLCSEDMHELARPGLAVLHRLTGVD